MTTVTVRMDDELAARLRQHADTAGVSPDELVERALSRFLDERPASRHLEFLGSARLKSCAEIGSMSC